MGRPSFKRDVFQPGLPAGGGAVLRAAALAGLGARTSDLAGRRILLDDEVTAALRVRGHAEPAGRRARVGRDLHRADTGAEVQAGVAEVRGGLALRVVLLVAVARLDLRDGVTSVGLRVGVLALLLLAE